MITITPEMNPVPVKSPWHHIGIDFVGPVPTSSKGNEYILTISDYCSKWVEAVALPTKCASAILFTKATPGKVDSLFLISHFLYFHVAVVQRKKVSHRHTIR